MQQQSAGFPHLQQHHSLAVGSGQSEPSGSGSGSGPAAVASRKRIAQSACELCRKKRTRCVIDPESDHPQKCNNCINLNADCVFSGVDRRKESVKDLRARLAELEQLFERLRNCKDDQDMQEQWEIVRKSEPNSNTFQLISPPPVSATFAASRNARVQDWAGASSIAMQDASRQTQSQSVSPPSRNNNFGESQTAFTGEKRKEQSDSAVPTLKRMKAAENQSGDVDLSDLIDKLSVTTDGRIRAHAALGNAAYSEAVAGSPPLSGGTHDKAYASSGSGSMSVLNSSRSSPQGETSEKSNGKAREMEPPITCVPAGTDVSIVQDLLHIYFMWHYPVFPVICRPVFIDHLCRGGKYATPLLFNAILALACVYSDNPLYRTDPTDPATAGDTFFAKAKELLEGELDSPTINTVQALSLLACREAMHGREVRGWLYSGMCTRQAIDLGLHIDARHLKAQGVLTDEDLHIRSRAFWAIWIVDKEFAALLGRPSTLSGIKITCPRPLDHKGEDFDWFASLGRGQITPLRQGMSTGEGALYPAEVLCNMADLFASASQEIYFKHNQTKTELLLALAKATRRIRKAINDLPDLVPNQTHLKRANGKGNGLLPGLITVYLFNYETLALIQRPFIRLLHLSSENDSNESRVDSPVSDLSFDGDTPRERYYNSSKEIMNCIKLYRGTSSEGLKTAINGIQHSIRTASLAFFNELNELEKSDDPKVQEKQQEVMAYLQKCEEYMEEIALTRPNARTALEALRSMLRARGERDSRRLGDLAHVAYSQDAGRAHTLQGTPNNLHNGVVGNSGTPVGQDYRQATPFQHAPPPLADQPYFSHGSFIPSLRHSVSRDQPQYNAYSDYSDYSMPIAEAAYPTGQVVRPHQLWHVLYEQQTLQAPEGIPSYSLPSGKHQDPTVFAGNNASMYAETLPNPSHFPYGYRGPTPY